MQSNILFSLVEQRDHESIAATNWDENQLNSYDAEGLTPLMRAAINGYDKVLLALLEKGANRNAVDVNGLKAVHHAAKHGHSLIIMLLIEGGSGG